MPATAARVVIGGSKRSRDAAIAEALEAFAGATLCAIRPANWPFMRRVGDTLPATGPLVIVARGLEHAFPDAQSGGTRLVLTQSTYQLQRWLDWIDARGDAALVADAHAASLRTGAPEAFANRGPWSRVTRVEAEHAEEPDPHHDEAADEPYAALSAAFHLADADARLARCRRVAEARPDDPVVWLALGSALMEVTDLDASQHAIERAALLAPEWEATHYELGKLLMRRDDLEAARCAFAEAGRLMPTFSAAFSNLGATLGELDRPDEALEAFRHALQYDPYAHTTLNNLGVVSRELGRLDESASALRRVIALAPEFVFGHYNLGHTLFLQGRYQAAVSAYAEGQRRDPQRNARQACRLALARLAAGDPDGSLRDLRQLLNGLPSDEKREILSEAQEILWALLTVQPSLAGWRQVSDVIQAELGTS